ncbi:hypothetical protein FQN57_005865 [Myotisia sp. PD_48]|nr:hypothetical protein FQN57_005865 [Myotisia sp. PD_48]
MHEILLFASIPAAQHHDLLQQLAGLAAMQPKHLLERRLIFKSYRKPGFLKARVGGSQDVQAPEIQRLNKMLGSGLYHVQVVGEVEASHFASSASSSSSSSFSSSAAAPAAAPAPTPALAPASASVDDATSGGPGASVPDVVMGGTGTTAPTDAPPPPPEWRIEFKDIPDAGTSTAITSRYVGSAKLSQDLISTMEAWGFNYSSEYLVEGDVIILDEIVLFVHRVLNFPPDEKPPVAPRTYLPPLDKMTLLDPTGSYVLQACLTIQDSSSPDLLKAASQRVLALKEQLKSSVKLEPADRLSLDTRVRSNITMAPPRGIKRSLHTKDISPPPTTKRRLESTTTKETVANFFKPASQKPPQTISWRIINKTCIAGKYSPAKSEKQDIKRRRIAAFDFDHTLVLPKSGTRFSRSASDWKWWDEQVPSKLRSLSSQGYLIAIVSNQKAISLKQDIKAGKSESKSLSMFKEKAAAVMKILNIPISLYAATESDEYRKPRMGMWNELLDDYDLDTTRDSIDLENSVFVGDAAGRPGDHSCCDRNIAANIGIPFKTPEEYFRDEPPEPVEIFNPKTYTTKPMNVEISFSKKNDQELVIFCGSPGSGKSTFYWKYLEPLNYERVNQDILKSRPKCLKVAKGYLQSGQSVAVDNTNADVATRGDWISLAKELNVPIRCIHLVVPMEICKHNNAVRAANPKHVSLNPESRSTLPPVAFGDFQRRYEEPSVDEGFQEILKLKFQFDGDGVTREIWEQHWM